MNFTYTWDIIGDKWIIWFGNKGSNNFFRARFGKDGDTAAGGWQWPEPGGRTG